ncbi:universal stress protein [Pseudaeromonas sp. ZJS20]|uniref:universal stress protein n=1 Tax=Pseudaeromonas aegiceratis TaxID=3153928 RepID=UPI00390CC545
MSDLYQHILVALDLDEEHTRVLDKAVALARCHHAKLSVIHVDINLQDLYTEMIALDIDTMQDKVLADANARLDKALAGTDYPIEKRLVICGDLCSKVNEAVSEYGIDLLVCGHRQTFWSLLTSSARQLMNSVSCDLLVMPLPE